MRNYSCLFFLIILSTKRIKYVKQETTICKCRLCNVQIMILPRANIFQSVDCSDCQYYLSLEGQRSIFDWLPGLSILAVRCWQDGQPRLLGKFVLPGLAERASRSGQTVSTVCSWTYLTYQPFHRNSFNSNCDAKTCQKLLEKEKTECLILLRLTSQLSTKSIPKILWTIKKNWEKISICPLQKRTEIVQSKFSICGMNR